MEERKSTFLYPAVDRRITEVLGSLGAPKECLKLCYDPLSQTQHKHCLNEECFGSSSTCYIASFWLARDGVYRESGGRCDGCFMSLYCLSGYMKGLRQNSLKLLVCSLCNKVSVIRTP